MRTRIWLRNVLGVAAAVALVAVTVFATGAINGPDGGTTVVADQPHCTGQCASCPLAGTDACKAATDTACDAHACAQVNADRCIGCGKCVRVAPEAFEINPETGKAEIRDGAPQDAVERGAQACPVGAIDR